MGKKRKDRPELGGLAGAFVKAGLTDRKKAERARREHRREEQATGRDEAARIEAERAAEHERHVAEEAEAARTRERERRGDETAERARRAIEAHRETTPGNRRWFFVARDGRVPFVEIPDSACRLLADGQAAVVESLGACADEHVVVLGEQAIAAVAAHDKDAVRFRNGAPAARRRP